MRLTPSMLLLRKWLDFPGVVATFVANILCINNIGDCEAIVYFETVYSCPRAEDKISLIAQFLKNILHNSSAGIFFKIMGDAELLVKEHLQSRIFAL